MTNMHNVKWTHLLTFSIIYLSIYECPVDLGKHMQL